MLLFSATLALNASVGSHPALLKELQFEHRKRTNTIETRNTTSPPT